MEMAMSQDLEDIEVRNRHVQDMSFQLRSFLYLNLSLILAKLMGSYTPIKSLPTP
jgi:hypothetical protein